MPTILFDTSMNRGSEGKARWNTRCLIAGATWCAQTVFGSVFHTCQSMTHDSANYDIRLQCSCNYLPSPSTQQLSEMCEIFPVPAAEGRSSISPSPSLHASSMTYRSWESIHANPTFTFPLRSFATCFSSAFCLHFPNIENYILSHRENHMVLI